MAKKRFLSGKTYTHSTGHSCAFRQWRADSHCKYVHGYAFRFKVWFEGELDDNLINGSKNILIMDQNIGEKSINKLIFNYIPKGPIFNKYIFIPRDKSI